MLYITTLLWSPNQASHAFSKCYDESWVEKLYRGFKRNLTRPFKFVCFVDRLREFSEPAIKQELLLHRPIGYGSCIEPYRLGEPMILVGLDTVITGNIDHMADYCLTKRKLAVPRDPYVESQVCNGVALVSRGHSDVYAAWTGQNDMEWIRIRSETDLIDDLFPGQVLSYKAHVAKSRKGPFKGNALPKDARIVYFHGNPKMHEIEDEAILEHWV